MSISIATLQAQATCPVITALIMSLDSYWPDDTSLVAAVPGVANTLASDVVTRKRAIAALDWAIRTHRPIWLNAAGQAADATALGALSAVVDQASYLATRAAYKTALANAWKAWSAQLSSSPSACATARGQWGGNGSAAVQGAWIGLGARAAWGFESPLTTWDAWIAFDSWSEDISIGSLTCLAGGTTAMNNAAASVRTSELALVSTLAGIVA